MPYGPRMDEETGSERHILEAHLDQNRAIVVSKVSGLSWEQATRRLGPSATSAAGILKHLIDVERWWFRRNLDGEADVPFSWSDDEPDLEFQFGPEETLDSLIAEYARACDESRAVAARYELTDQIHPPGPGEPRSSLRWVYVHMIEEVARHNGHLDIYREVIDGQVGYE
jgi:uncharacterized damage-inducible protein DinB